MLKNFLIWDSKISGISESSENSENPVILN